MKKILSLLLISALFVGVLVGCNEKKQDENVFEPAHIRIGGLKGPTTMGMVQLMDKAEAGTAANNYTFTIAASADELTPKLIKGELDIVAVPANLASVLYNNTDKEIKLLAINTL